MSAATGQGIKELIQRAYQELQDIPKMPLCEIEEIVYQPEEEEDFRIVRDGDLFIVEGSYIEYLINSINFEDNESLQYFQNTLKRKGIVEALEEAGIQEGDTVRMYELEFDFVY